MVFAIVLMFHVLQISSVEYAEKNPRKLDAWINSIKDLHQSKPPPTVIYSKPMPDVEKLMQVRFTRSYNVAVVYGSHLCGTSPSWFVCSSSVHKLAVRMGILVSSLIGSLRYKGSRGQYTESRSKPQLPRLQQWLDVRICLKVGTFLVILTVRLIRNGPHPSRTSLLKSSSQPRNWMWIWLHLWTSAAQSSTYLCKFDPCIGRSARHESDSGLFH